jgi:hypothetical protein
MEDAMHPRELPPPSLDLAKLKLPPKPRVRRVVIEPYVDHTGEDELRVWIVLDDSTTDRDFMSIGVRRVERVITDALLEMGERRFPYTRFVRSKEYRRRRAS